MFLKIILVLLVWALLLFVIKFTMMPLPHAML